MGGTCTNDGCVPTRVLAKAARLARDAEQFEQYGLVGGRPTVDLPRLLARTRQVVDEIHEKKRLLRHLEEAGVTVMAHCGDARFVDAHTVAVGDGGRLRGEKILLCAGGHARRLPFPGSELALTHSDIWSLSDLPRSVVVVGAAATGCQIASVMAAFGADVILLEMAPRILAGEDEQVSETLTASLTQRGITVTTGIEGCERIECERIEQAGDMLHVHYTHEGKARMVKAEAVVIAVGWPGNVDGLNLEAAGVKTERGYVVVDDALRTSVPHIFAAGDITGRMMLVQSANDEARIAAENAVLGAERTDAHQIVPHGGFTDPEYGSVGLTESRAREAHDCAVAVVSYAELDRAVIDGRPEGFCKLIVSRGSREILGAHVVGEQALEVVQIVAAGMAAGMRVEQLADLELAYPTFTGIVGLAARHLCRELGVMPISPQWRGQGRLRAAEWEHSARD